MHRSIPVLVALAIATGGFPPIAAPERAASPPALTKEEWRRDLRHLAKQLPERHKNAFHATSKESFDRAVAELDAAIPTLADHQILVRMKQIVATVGDGHTGIHLPPYFKRYPLGLFWFGKDLRVIAAGAEYEKALGTRVVEIGGVAIDEVQARVATCFPSAANENDWYVLATSPAFLGTAEVLHALGIVPQLEAASFTLETDSGERFGLEIRPVAVPVVDGRANLGLTPLVEQEPLFRQRPGERFWFTHLPESQTVYVSWRGYDGLGENAKKLFKFLDANPVSRLVIDLRQNGGGDFFEGRENVIEPVKKRPALDAEGRLFVLVGRRTYSAAMVNAIDFSKQTQAILVGEPIGERPNSYSENDEMKLPNSGLVVSYSTRYYRFLDQDVPAFVPDEVIPPSWEAFRAGRDPVMEWVLARPAVAPK